MHRGRFVVDSDFLAGHPSCDFDSDAIETMNSVLDYYGDKEPQWLSDLTHKEAPWKEARVGVPTGFPCSAVITKESMQQYINIPKYLSMHVSTWNTGRTNGWDFKEQYFVETISKSVAFERITKLKNTESFRTLEYRFKQIAVAFYLWCKNENDDYHCINKEIVNKEIEECGVKVINLSFIIKLNFVQTNYSSL